VLLGMACQQLEVMWKELMDRGGVCLNHIATKLVVSLAGKQRTADACMQRHICTPLFKIILMPVFSVIVDMTSHLAEQDMPGWLLFAINVRVWKELLSLRH
jgi:hypothetical protein